MVGTAPSGGLNRVCPDNHEALFRPEVYQDFKRNAQFIFKKDIRDPLER